MLPPVVAITLAIATRRVVISLLVGVFCGALILAQGNVVTAAVDTLVKFLWGALYDEDHLRIFAFTLLMGAMVGVVRRSGGMIGIVDHLAPLARSRRGGQLVTWGLGLIIFFDDYANSLLLGTTMRPLCDRLKISREKLAYLVDSTAAPVAGLAIVSTWVAGEIGYIESGLTGLTFASTTPASPPPDGFEFFIATIPYRFYVLWSLLLVPLVAIFGRDFGSMLAAERRALRADEEDRPKTPENELPGLAPEAAGPRRWTDAVGPIAVTVGVILWLLIATGQAALAEKPGTPATWMNIFGAANANVSLVYGALAGLLASLLLVIGGRSLTLPQAAVAALGGARLMLPALAILWLAWSLSSVTDKPNLATGAAVGELLQQMLRPEWMPTIVFVLAAVVAFCTGTSWGTMGILMALVIQTTHQLLATQGNGAGVAADDPVLIASIGSVLAGAIFGDHCSPISDTTILSSQASGCDHVAHVWTQLPYALVVAAIAILCGTIPIGFGFPVTAALLLGTLALVAALLLAGGKVESPAPAEKQPVKRS